MINLKIKKFVSFLLLVSLFSLDFVCAKQIQKTNFLNKQLLAIKNYEKATALFGKEKYKEAFKLFYEIWDDFEMKSMILYYLYLYVHNEKFEIKKNDKEIIKYFLLESKKYNNNREYITALINCNKILILNKNSKNVNYIIEDIKQKIKNMIYSRDFFSLADYHYGKAFNEFFANELDKFILDADKCLILDKTRTEIAKYLNMLKKMSKQEIKDFFDLDAKTFECVTCFDNRQYQDFNKFACKILSISEDDIIILSFLFRYLKLSNFEEYLKQMNIKEMLAKLKEKKLRDQRNYLLYNSTNSELNKNKGKKSAENYDEYLIRIDDISLALSNYREKKEQEKLKEMIKERIQNENIGIKNIEKRSYDNINKVIPNESLKTKQISKNLDISESENEEYEKYEKDEKDTVDEHKNLLNNKRYTKITREIIIEKRYLYGKTIKNLDLLRTYKILLDRFNQSFSNILKEEKKSKIEIMDLKKQSIKKDIENEKKISKKDMVLEQKNKLSENKALYEKLKDKELKNKKKKEEKLKNKRKQKDIKDKELKEKKLNKKALKLKKEKSNK